MKREYVKLFSFMIGISLVIASIIFVISSNIKAAKQKEIDEEDKVMDEIGDIYVKFNIMAEDFASKHDSFIKTVDNDTAYFAIVADNYNKLIAAAKEYETALTEINDMDTYLFKNCRKKFYSNADINQDCLAYVRNKEKLTNTYIDDITYLNHRIEAFNDWTVTNNASVIATRHYDKLKLFESKYTEYVDLDEDGLKLGANLD